ncbi:hypothetical protein ACLMJK_008048 [Lecanora helva]
MNNTQFRRLVLDTPTATKNDIASGSVPQNGGTTPALGSRMRSNIPMTPRSVAGSSNSDFKRQLAERDADLNPAKTKKFRSSAAPKGTKLGAGYHDRTKLRTSAEEDDKAVRVKALEEMVKLGQMEQATFEALRDEIVGGDVKDVHLVKGLDYKLLERVRRGEDVLSNPSSHSQKQEEAIDEYRREEPAKDIDVDEELGMMEEKEVQPVEKEERMKKGEMAPPPVAGKKRTRDDILKELKASRQAAAEKAKQSALGPKFMKVGQKQETSRIEKDERGREVLISVDEDGKVKRKVKKAKVVDQPDGHGLLMPDKDAKPLGMEVTPVAPPPAEEDTGDIFEGVGTDYNPLGDVPDDDDSDDSEEAAKAPPNDEAKSPPPSPHPKTSETRSQNMLPPLIPPNKKRNWLGDSYEEKEKVEVTPPNPLTDPTILAALKKASTINTIPPDVPKDAEEAAKLARRKKMLESQDRDAEDMDMEFGSSRFGDQEEGEDSKIKLSVWGGDGEKGEGEGKGKGKGGRKKGPKKMKGDANSAADVLRVMERRKNEGR